MTSNKIFEKLKLPKVLILLSIIILSCTILIFTNYYTIKILSANRAYINGESHYSKGQKDAVRHLITYLYTKDKEQWKLFKTELSVPQSSEKARIELTNNEADSLVKIELIKGRNHESDFDEMIWLFKNFHNVPFYKKAIHEWKQADALITQIDQIGNKIHQLNETSELTHEAKQKLLTKISDISDKLTINERNFSNTLGEGTREVKGYLIYINIILILIIICSVGIYFSVMVKKLMLSKQETENKNKDLVLANHELDRFVYSASHDLRSPIASLYGLVEIIKIEKDPEQVAYYLDLMKQVLMKQDQFISDIIDYSRNKRLHETIGLVSLIDIVDDAIKQHQYIEEASKITIEKNMAADQIYSDNLRLKIIINNLFSNAIKYSDSTKEKQSISINSQQLNGNYIIEIEDNGIGIPEKNKDKIFDMFFVTDSNKGSGLGLYIVKEAIENMNGSIAVESEINVGSKFTVTIPRHNNA